MDFESEARVQGSAAADNRLSAVYNTGDVLRKARNEAQKKRLMAAFDDYRATSDGGSIFMEVVDFTKRHLYYLETEFSEIGTATTVDDKAQEVTIAVCNVLDTFEGDALNFYKWLWKVVKNQGADLFNELKDQKYNKLQIEVQLPVKEQGQRGAWERVENPVLHKSEINPTSICFPDSFSQIDRNICTTLLEMTLVRRKDGTLDDKHLTYAAVGKKLSMTEGAVKMRIQRMRAKMDARVERLAAVDRKREADEAAWCEHLGEQVQRIRESKQVAGAAG